MSSKSPEQMAAYQPIEAGDNLAYVRQVYRGVGSEYLTAEAVRPNGTIARFGEMTSTGVDGAREGFGLSDKAEAAKDGRRHIYVAVGAVMQLEKMVDPEFDNYITQTPPVGDWEPSKPTIDLDLVQKGLRGALSDLALRRSARSLMEKVDQNGGIDSLNEILDQDEDIAVGLQGPKSHSSIVKLVGFENFEYIDPISGAQEIGPRVIVEDRELQRGLRPVEYRIERAFVKQY